MPLRLFLISFVVLGCMPLMARQLSPEAEISLLTIDPGSELYSAFGHTAVWVHDPATRVDRVYNYGTFDFEPGKELTFYLNFAQGRLNYRLDTESYDHFRRVYQYFERAYSGQLLALTPDQKQAVYDYLETNNLPENRYYLYEFFYDNCATRVRDVFKTVLADSLHYAQADVPTDETFRDLLWVYLADRYWAKFGIDLALGAVVDRPVTPWQRMFLPDFLAEEIARAELVTSGGERRSLVTKQQTLYGGVPALPAEPWYLRPAFFLWLLAAAIGGLTYRQWRQARYRPLWDVLLFALSGLGGLVLLLLWTATIHTAPAQNYNLLWLLPTHLVAAFALIPRTPPRWLRPYFLISAALTALPILGWYLLPQRFDAAFLPWMLMLLARSLWLAQGRPAHQH
jgi:hypothetical protein